jgi:hypothetical protein
MVSPVHSDYRRCQAEIPLIVLCRFPEPALNLPNQNDRRRCAMSVREVAVEIESEHVPLVKG